MELGLNGRRVLVTGGSQGIGLATARAFLLEGAEVAIAARDESRLARAVAQLAEIPGARVIAKSIDLAQRGAPEALVNVLGLGGERPQWRYVCGNAANVALAGVTKSLGGRSIDDGIRVVGVNPGGVETERLIAIQKARAAREL